MGKENLVNTVLGLAPKRIMNTPRWATRLFLATTLAITGAVKVPRTQVSNEVAFAIDKYEIFPSPDGYYLAYIAPYGNDKTELRVIDKNGRIKFQYNALPNDTIGKPVWNPTNPDTFVFSYSFDLRINGGRQLEAPEQISVVFIGSIHDTALSLYSFTQKGSEVRLDPKPHFSGDGRRIIYDTPSGKFSMLPDGTDNRIDPNLK